MSWLPQRWRTQRNAIRNANCRIQWIIKPLNASCASGICLGACVTECLSHPSPHGVHSPVAVESAARAGSLMAGSWRQVKLSSRRLLTLRFVRGGVSGFRAFTTRPRIISSHFARGAGRRRRGPVLRLRARDTVSITGDTHFLSLRYARRPAEFKHITKRRKRN